MRLRDHIYYAGKLSSDYGIYITDNKPYSKPSRSYKAVEVPGRNGDLILENGRYENQEWKYSAVVIRDFKVNYEAWCAFLLSQKGYKRLEDSCHPDEYYMATVRGIDGIETALFEKTGTFTMVFERKPQRFLKSGEKARTFTAGGELKNPTLFEARPLIRAYGTGTVTVAGVTVRINSANSYTDLDCDLQEAYRGSVNCNSNITLTNGEFPALNPGMNAISMSGITKLEITPRWWTI